MRQQQLSHVIGNQEWQLNPHSIVLQSLTCCKWVAWLKERLTGKDTKGALLL